MQKDVYVTLTKVYKKEVRVKVDAKLVKDLTDEEVAKFLQEKHVVENEEVLFDNAELEQIDFNEDSLPEADTDRFDIYDNEGHQTYGGHL